MVYLYGINKTYDHINIELLRYLLHLICCTYKYAEALYKYYFEVCRGSTSTRTRRIKQKHHVTLYSYSISNINILNIHIIQYCKTNGEFRVVYIHI